MATGELNDESDILGSAGLECPICLEVYKDPRALACLHTFCFGCLDVLVLKSKEEGQLKGGIDCPICRTTTNIVNKDLSPEEWSKELPRNYALAAALHTLNKYSEIDKNPLCQSCIENNESNKASMFCVSCGKFQCDDCVAAHKRFSRMKGHTMKHIDSCEEDNQMFDFTHLLHCHEHNKLIKYYCTDHEELCCTTCAIITHKRCDTVEIRNVNKKVNDKDVKRNMAHMTRTIEHVCGSMAENEKYIDSDILKIEDRLTIIRRKVLERLDKFEKDIRDEMLNKKQSVKAVNDKTRDETNRLAAALEGSISMIDTVTQNGSLETKFVVMEKLKQQCTIYRKSVNEVFLQAKSVRMNLRVDDSLTQFSESNNELGMVETVAEKLKAITKNLDLKQLKCIEMKSVEGKETPLISGLGFLSDGRSVMIDNTNDECLIMDDTLVQLTSCKLSFTPHSLTVLTTDEVLITSGRSIHIYNVDRENVLTRQSTIKIDLKVFDISEMDKDTFAVSCIDTNIPVQRVTRQGNVSQFTGEFPDVNYTPDAVRCSYSRMDDHLVVALRDLDEIRVVDTKYNTTTVIKDDTMIKRPTGVVVVNDNSRSFYVCSNDTNSIPRISFDGVNLVYHKLTDMILPYSIAISVDNDALVVSSNYTGGRKVMLLKHN